MVDTAPTNNMEILKLNIYAATEEKVQACKKELDKTLGKALATMSWSDKDSYPDDKQHIANLSEAQVCQKCHLSVMKLSFYSFVYQALMQGLLAQVHLLLRRKSKGDHRNVSILMR